MIATHDASDTAHETRFKLFEKIADFGNDIIKKLALTTAITAITALETGSWFGQLLKMVLTASGVKYNIAQNGYVCLGSFFGGLIIQWGIVSVTTDNAQGPHNASQALPLAANIFLQGTASYDFPTGISIPVAAISCNATTVYAGAQLLPGYTGSPVNIRWFGLFK